MVASKATTPLLPRLSTSSGSSHGGPAGDTQELFIGTRHEAARYEVLSRPEMAVGSSADVLVSTTPTAVGRIVSVLLTGSFMSNADGSLLYATHPVIASEFNALHNSTWLIASFALAQAVSQPLYGKLSDIYGRKSMLILAYTLFATGLVLVGIGQSMSTLILGRVISGLGSSGMTSLLSILITDLVPLRDVATWRSYVNIVATTGRSIGGPLGGWMADTVGWRNSFNCQVPVAGIAIALVVWTLPAHNTSASEDDTRCNNFARIDLLGAACMTLSILGLLLPLEIGGDSVSWSSSIIITLLGGAMFFGLLFLYIEAWVAQEPIVPIHLLQHRDVVASGFVMLAQCAAQTTLMFAVPLYFQVTRKASNSVAGAHLIPAVVGNALGGIFSGRMIKRTGQYKILAILATISASVGYLLLIVRWHGGTNWLESLYIFPCGFAMGIMQSALFISMQAGIAPEFAAIATSVLYLTQPTGNVAGLAVASAVLQGTLQRSLDRRLDGLGIMGEKHTEIVEKAVSDVHYMDKVTPLIAKAVVGSYIEALTWTHVLSLALALTAFIGTLFLRQHQLQ